MTRLQRDDQRLCQLWTLGASFNAVGGVVEDETARRHDLGLLGMPVVQDYHLK